MTRRGARPAAAGVLAAALWAASSLGWAQRPDAAHQATPAAEGLEMLNAALWMQQAQEYRAQVMQTYRQAGQALGAALRGRGSAAVEQHGDPQARTKPPAVVLDVDETVLDNLPFSAGLVKAGRAYDDAAEAEWQRWVLAGQAPVLPGAAAFVERARRAGARVVFITDRECPRAAAVPAPPCAAKEATRRNLQQALGVEVTAQDLLVRHDTPGRDDREKTARRAEVARTHRIVMLLGDDLRDFVPRADYRPQQHDALWGSRWFLFANPLYGSWERGFPTVARKREALRAWTADAGSPATLPSPPPRPSSSGTAGDAPVAPSPPPAGPHRLRVASWNLEWLVSPQVLQQADWWRRCARGDDPAPTLLPPCDAYRRGGINDDATLRARKLEPLREGLSALAARGLDVLAVQEVHDAGVLQSLLPRGWRVACLSEGPRVQQVGFVVREALLPRVQCQPLPSLTLGQPGLRPGLALRLQTEAGPRVLLNLHLKSGCPGGPLDDRRPACATLQQQVPALEAWVEARAHEGVPFLLLGDFNRDLAAERRHPARHDGSDPRTPVSDATRLRNLWPEIVDGEPADSALVQARLRRADEGEAGCSSRVDHLVLGTQWLARLAPERLQAGVPVVHQVRAPRGASDHCALWAELVER